MTYSADPIYLDEIKESSLSRHLKFGFWIILGILWDQAHVLKFFSYEPYISLGILYYWILNYKTEIRVRVVFVLGLVSDFIGGTVWGYNTFNYLAIYTIINYKNLESLWEELPWIPEKKLIDQWKLFFLILCALSLFQYGFILISHHDVLTSWFDLNFMLINTILIENFLTFLTYPIIYRCFK